MKIVVLDGYTENPGDLSWAALEPLGEVTVYDRTSYVDAPIIAERIGDAEVAVMNKTPIRRATMDQYAFALLLENCHHSQTVFKGKWANHADWCYWHDPLIELDGKPTNIVNI
ncbi:hypothetical protein ACTQ33_14750 [Candidatus Avoscillospira sp. LCP25S3_F1]|uniref:hypothetical protein n=1 Tax=Candidatus Avoscillospira sp. LCP25S3_F1 TaxID=3438825 RepID=UPI003F90D0FF